MSENAADPEYGWPREHYLPGVAWRLLLCRLCALLSVGVFAASVVSIEVRLPDGRRPVYDYLGDLLVFPTCCFPGFAWALCIMLAVTLSRKRPSVWVWVVIPPAGWILSLIGCARLFGWR